MRRVVRREYVVLPDGSEAIKQLEYLLPTEREIELAEKQQRLHDKIALDAIREICNAREARYERR